MKKFKFIFLFILSIVIFKTVDVQAFSMWSNATTVYTGSQVAVTVDMSDLTGKFLISSSNQNILAGGETNWYENQSTTIYFTALNPGQAVVTAYSNNPSDVNGDNQGEVSRSIIINVIDRPVYNEPIEVNRTYSSNNYLSGLTVEGYNIIPEFDKEVLEYSMEVDYNVFKVNIGATLEDDTATVAGTGEVDLEEGKNTFIIKVTAENGNEREYVLNILVKELNPTKVKVNQKDYTSRALDCQYQFLLKKAKNVKLISVV